MEHSYDVFVSSTCYDLADLRAELAAYLKSEGFSVRLSEDPESAFFVEPLGDSIESCLKNVESSGAVIAILDRRYGGFLPTHHRFAGISATHAEIRHARDTKRPIHYFIRQNALNEYHQLRANPHYSTKWIEPDEESRRLKYYEMVKELFSLPEHAGISNWYDTFQNSTDLKPLVHRRLLDIFPAFRGYIGLRPDRFVRMTFIKRIVNPQEALGRFRNIGVGPAVNVRHGIAHGRVERKGFTVGGVPECESITGYDREFFEYDLRPSGPGLYLFCEYSNRYNDRYRVEVPIEIFGAAAELGSEKLFIGRFIDGKLEWTPIEDSESNGLAPVP